MITQTSAAIGATGQFLEGTNVSTSVGENLFRESIVIAGPESSDAYVNPVSSQPVDQYGVPTWMQGTTQVNIVSSVALGFTPSGTTQVSGTVSTQVVSSIPFYVSQSTSPWVVIGSTQIVSSLPLIIGSSVPHAIVGTSQVFGTVSSQIISSIPFFVAQSSAPWAVAGTTNVQGTSSVNVISSAPHALVGTSMVNIVSSLALNVNMLGTTLINVVSSVVQGVTITSSVIHGVNAVGTSTSLLNVTSKVALATLNTTVIKAGPGVLYGYHVSNFASTSVFLKVANASSGVIASTANFLLVVGASPSTSSFNDLSPLGMNFSTGITVFTMREAWPQGLTAPLGSTCVFNLMYI